MSAEIFLCCGDVRALTPPQPNLLPFFVTVVYDSLRISDRIAPIVG